MQNNRKHERYNHRLSVQLKDRKGSHPLKTGNISRFGLFLITSDVKNLRELIKLEVQLPHSGRNLEILAQVMWVDKEGKSSNPGMGVKFFSMPDDIKREWEQFVDMVRTGRVQETPPDLPEDNPMHSGTVHAIGEEELQALEGVDSLESLDDLEDIDLGDMMNGDEPDSAQDLSAAMADYDPDGNGLNQALEEIETELIDDDDEAGPPPLPETDDPPPSDGSERREFPRKAVSFLVNLENIEALKQPYTRDVSLGGLFLETGMALKVGQTVNLRIVHPWTRREFPMKAAVRRAETDSNGRPAGVGVEFMEIDDDLRDSLLTFIESGFVIIKEKPDIPIESQVIRLIEETEEQIKQNPIDNTKHYEVGLLYLCLSDWEKAGEHLGIALNLGYPVPEEIKARLQAD